LCAPPSPPRRRAPERGEARPQKCEAGDRRAEKRGEKGCNPAPTAADGEHTPIQRDEKLRRKVTLLRKLGIVERLLAGLEIGAAVLPVGIEKQRVKLAVEIVVVRRVAPRPRARIELFDAAMEVADEPLQPRQRRRSVLAALTDHDGKDIGDGALFDENTAVHISFAESQGRIEEHAALGCSGGEADRRRRAGPVPEGKARAGRGPDPEISGADQPSQGCPKQPIHRPPPTASTSFARATTGVCGRWLSADRAAARSRPAAPFGREN